MDHIDVLVFGPRNTTRPLPAIAVGGGHVGADPWWCPNCCRHRVSEPRQLCPSCEGGEAA